MNPSSAAVGAGKFGTKFYWQDKGEGQTIATTVRAQTHFISGICYGRTSYTSRMWPQLSITTKHASLQFPSLRICYDRTCSMILEQSGCGYCMT